MKYFYTSTLNNTNSRPFKQNKLMLMAALGILFIPSLSIASSEVPDLCPVVKNAFTFGGQSSNQVTWQMLPYMDETFLRQTGGKDETEKLKRAVGAVELLLLVRFAKNGGTIQEKESAKLAQAQDEMGKELKKLGKTSLLSDYLVYGTIPMDDLVAVLNSVKGTIKQPTESTEKKCVIM